MFLEICKRTGLDPFLKEIWYVAEKNIIMAGRDGYLRVANEHPQFDGIETRVERDDQKMPVKAVCTVWRKDRGHPTICEAYFSEYRAAGPVWKSHPAAMISKVAEVLALKRSFAINGVVSEEEMDATNHPVSPVTQGSSAAPVQKVADVPKEVQDAWDYMTNIARTCEIFAQLKKRMVEVGGPGGEAEYYRLLKKHGDVKHANEFKSAKPARITVQRMWESIQLAESLNVNEEDLPEGPEAA
jgi:hypothetical protein